MLRPGYSDRCCRISLENRMRTASNRLPGWNSPTMPGFIAAAALLIAGLALHFVVMQGDSATEDETVHLHAAVAMVAQGRSSINLEHPPLARLLAGSALHASKVDPGAGVEIWDGARYAESAVRFAYLTPPPLERKLRVARKPFLFLTALLAIATALMAHLLFGGAAALVSLTLILFMPLVVAMGHLVHTDVPVTFATTAGLLAALLPFHAQPGRRWLSAALSGSLLGLALLAKYSALVLLPLVALALWIGVSARVREKAFLLLVGTVAAMVVAWSGMAVAFRNADDAWTASLVASLQPAAAPLLDSAILRPAGLYLTGLEIFLRRGDLAINYFLGDFSLTGWWYYFPAALLVKTPLPFLALLLLGAIVRIHRRLDRLDAMLLVPVAGYLIASAFSTYNIGVRHQLPIVPLLIVWSSRLLEGDRSDSVESPRAVRYVALALTGLTLLTSVSAFPHYLGYFNLLSGGRETATFILSDSNVDWGQDNRRLYEHLRRKDLLPARTLLMGGAFPEVEMGPGVERIDPYRPPSPGVHAVSRALLVELTRFAALPPDDPLRTAPPFRQFGRFSEPYGEYLLRLVEQGEKIGEVGNSIDIYRWPAVIDGTVSAAGPPLPKPAGPER